MGDCVSKLGTKISDIRLPFVGGVKRSASEAELDDDAAVDALMNTPKRRKLKSTSAYIYEKLYENGEGSDVTIVALNREWMLHKVYLSQAPYFDSMFNGNWRESRMNVVDLKIPDDIIDEEAIDVALGSLYRDDIFITPAKVVSVLAVATLFSLEELIQQAAGIMMESLSNTTAAGYYVAATRYGLFTVADACFKLLERRLMNSQTVQLLSEISVELMERLLASPDLFICQVEMDVYSMLRKWLFLKHNADWMGTMKELSLAADAYIKSEASKWGGSFLETADGVQYREVFDKLRVDSIIVDHQAARILETDAIIPRDCLSVVYRRRWLSMLRIDQGVDLGPESVDETVFNQSAMRCGRVLTVGVQHIWRWTGFNYGLDIVVTFKNRTVYFKRNTVNCHGAVSSQSVRRIGYCLSVSSAQENSRPGYSHTTGLKILSLSKDQDTLVMAVDQCATFPLYVSCSFLFCSVDPADSLAPPVSKSLAITQADAVTWDVQ